MKSNILRFSSREQLCHIVVTCSASKRFRDTGVTHVSFHTGITSGSGTVGLHIVNNVQKILEIHNCASLGKLDPRPHVDSSPVQNTARMSQGVYQLK